ncbi:MAG: hypothetical protein HY903_13390 [Deltaproteobacteria bacterium]|nr:hypothetical protein [Deltaproteobacteria bacterium]
MTKLVPVFVFALTVTSGCSGGCPDGAVDCACRAGDRCDAGLYCVLGVCTEPGAGLCGDGRVAQGEECDGNAVTNGTCGANCRLSCNLGFKDCNAATADGCEADVRVSLDHCGDCGQRCNGAGGSATCDQGNCSLTCSADYADCNLDPQDGCETALATSSSHCGSCDHSCLGGGCAASTCLPVVVAAASDVQDVAVDAAYAYYTRLGSPANGFADGSVVRLDKATRVASAVAASQKAPAWLVVDDTYVYWASIGVPPSYRDGGIFRVLKNGDSPTPLAPDQEFPGDLATDGTNLYWVTPAASGSVAAVATSGGGGWSVASTQATPAGVAADGSRVFWTNQLGGTLMAADPNGSNPTPLVSALDGPRFLQVDQTQLFWVDWDTSRVRRASKTGAGAVEMSQETGEIGGIAVDATDVYWTVDRGASSSSVMAAPKGGGAAREVASQIDSPMAIAVDLQAIYWVSPAGLVRLAK